MMKQKLSRLLALVIILVLFVSSFSACKKTEDKEEKAMGRYVEEVLELPEKYNEYQIIALVKNAEGKIEVFLQNYAKPFIKLIMEDGWQEQEQKWLDSIITNADSTHLPYISNITLGEDGVYYALTSEKSGYTVYQSQEEGTIANKIPISFLEEEVEVFSKYHIDSIGVLKNGTILLCDRNAKKTMMFSNKTGQLIKEIDMDVPFTIRGDSYMGIKSGERTLVYYNEEETKEVALASNNWHEKLATTQDATYLLNSDGIHRLENEGTIWQTVVDGGLTSLAMPNNIFKDFIINDNNEFYVIISNYPIMPMIYHYYYDETLPSVPEQQITVYSLYENERVRRIIKDFQSANSDVKVNYEVAFDFGDVNYADAIRLLNTELLAGSGADILVLDGLPFEVFNEKGILADLSDIVSPMMEDGTLIANIADCFTDNKKFYAVPIFFQPLFYYGSEEVLNALTDLDSLVAYIKEHPEEKIFSSISYKKLANQFFEFNYDTLINDDGNIEKDTLLHFLENLNVVSENIGAVEIEEFIDPKGKINLRNSRTQVDLDITNGSTKAGIMQVECIDNLAFPMQSIRNNNLSYRGVNSLFVPKTIIGLNQASNKKELAKEFIKSLLSENGHVITYNDNGLPVNEKALMEVADTYNSNNSIGLRLDNDTYHYANYPTKEETKEIITSAKELTRPILYSSINDQVCEMIAVYLGGESTAEQTAEDIINLINLSLSE